MPQVQDILIVYIFSFNPKPLSEVVSPFTEDKTETES